MIKILKRTGAALLLAVTVLSLAACAKKETPSMDAETRSMLIMGAEQAFSTIISMSSENLDSTIEQFEYEQNTVYVNGLNSWKSSADELGGLVGIREETAEIQSDGSYRVVIDAVFEKRNCEFIMALDKRMSDITELTFNPEYTLREKMGQAGINLIIGMGTVFAVLIFLTWIISLFKYIGKAEAGLGSKKAAFKENRSEAAEDTALTGAKEYYAEDEEEIKAVIAAAIAAYEEDKTAYVQPTLDNGITVRSFRRGDRR